MSKQESGWSLTDIFILQISAPMSLPQSQDPPKAGLPQLDFFPHFACFLQKTAVYSYIVWYLLTP